MVRCLRIIVNFCMEPYLTTSSLSSADPVGDASEEVNDKRQKVTVLLNLWPPSCETRLSRILDLWTLLITTNLYRFTFIFLNSYCEK